MKGNSNIINSDNLSGKLPVLLIVLVVAVYIGLVIYTAGKGPSVMQDDHWYMKDIRHFIATGRMETNEIYPAMLAHNMANPPKVLHNLPLMYPVIPFVMMFGSYWGWIIANMMYSLLTCLILVQIIRLLKGTLWQCLAVISMFLLWIMTVHVSAHPLAEAGVLFYISLLTWIFVKLNESSFKYLLLGIIMAVIILNRVSFAVLFVLLVIWLIILRREKPENRWLQLFVFGTITIALSILGSYLLPVTKMGVFTPLRMPANQAMLHFYQLQHQHFSFAVFAVKVLDSIKLQLMGRNITHTVFVTIFNLLIISFLIFGLRSKDEKQQRFELITLFYVSVYFATLVWFQYQTRFLHTVMPFLLVWLVLRFPYIKQKSIPVMIVAGFCLINLGGDIYNGRQNRKDAVLTSQMEQAYIQIQTQYNIKGSVLVEGNCKLLPWVMEDNPGILMCDPEVNTTQELLWMRDKIPYEWIISVNDSGLIDSLACLKPKLITVLPLPMTEFSLYRVAEDK